MSNDFRKNKLNQNDDKNTKKNDDKKENKKELEIVSDNGSTLDISPVRENINLIKSTENKPRNIVIPQDKNK